MSLSSKRRIGLAFVFSGLAALTVSSVALATHARPRGATPKLDALVIDYRPCPAGGAPNTHGMPLAVPSCPPVKMSPFLTVGTPDVNGVAAMNAGVVRQDVVLAPPDITVNANMTDIRCEPPLPAAVCVPNGPGPPAYTGSTEILVPIDITDHCNYPGAPAGCPAPPPGLASTVSMTVTLRFGMPCAIVAPGVGSTCSTSTSWNAIIPGVIPPAAAGTRMNIEVQQVSVTDGGPDGNAGTAPNQPFAISGLWSP